LRNTVFAFALCASPAAAGGYSDHAAIQVFANQPCSETVAAIDWLNEVDPEAYTLTYGLRGTVQAGAKSAMMWGILLGYDARAGGLHTQTQSTLERLKSECANAPEKSARDILDEL